MKPGPDPIEVSERSVRQSAKDRMAADESRAIWDEYRNLDLTPLPAMKAPEFGKLLEVSEQSDSPVASAKMQKASLRSGTHNTKIKGQERVNAKLASEASANTASGPFIFANQLNPLNIRPELFALQNPEVLRDKQALGRLLSVAKSDTERLLNRPGFRRGYLV